MNEQDLLSTVKAKCQLVIILCTIMVSADVLILLVCLLHQEPLQIGVGLLLLNGLILITIWLALFKPFLGLISEKEQQYKTETAQLGTQIQQYKLSVAEGDLIRSIILSVSESSNYDTAIYQFIKHICDSTGWIFAQNWNFSEDSGAVHCGKIWYSRLDHFKWFRRSNEGIVFRSGEGLPGRVLKSKQAIWISDIQSESIFLRQEISAHANFRSAIAVPILVEDQIITIIEFFSVTQVEADEKHLQLVTDVASLLGLVFTQKLARQALERSEERYRIIAESTNEGTEKGCDFLKRLK